jgi:hypothetical protein
VSSINPQIDAAVVLMKARAAEFDGERSMDGVDFINVVVRAERNVHDALYENLMRMRGAGYDHKRMERDLVDTMNLCALALSLLPTTPEADDPRNICLRCRHRRAGGGRAGHDGRPGQAGHLPDAPQRHPGDGDRRGAADATARDPRPHHLAAHQAMSIEDICAVIAQAGVRVRRHALPGELLQRRIEFKVRDTTYTIDWWANKAYLSVGRYQNYIPFTTMAWDDCWPSYRRGFKFWNGPAVAAYVAIDLLDWQEEALDAAPAVDSEVEELRRDFTDLLGVLKTCNPHYRDKTPEMMREWLHHRADLAARSEGERDDR